MNTETILEAKEIYKSYGALHILKGISLSIQSAEIVSIVGASGAGKTTLLHILGTLDRMDSGQLLIDGIEVARLNSRQTASLRNRSLGFVFQNHALLPEMTALENVCAPALIGGQSFRKAKHRALELLSYMGLQERKKHKPNQLSGGECQRIAVARALMNEPRLIFADEPSGSLDTENKESLHQLFFNLREQYGQTFVIVTHDVDFAGQADRMIFLKDGQVAR